MPTANSVNNHIAGIAPNGFNFTQSDATLSGQVVSSTASGTTSWGVSLVNAWTAYTPTITSTGGTPNLGVGTTQVGYYTLMANGKILFITYRLNQTAAGTNGAPPGTYLFSIPAGFTPNTTVLNVSTTAFQGSCVGFFSLLNGVNAGAGQMFLYSTTQLQASASTIATAFGQTALIANNFNGLGAASLVYSFNAWIPIV